MKFLIEKTYYETIITIILAKQNKVSMYKFLRFRRSSRPSGMCILRAKGAVIGFLSLMLFVAELQAQNITVTGRIISADNNEPLPGVNVAEKGTSNGTVTDINGTYSLSVPQGAALVFSFIGYESVEEAINGRSVINLSLTPNLEQLQEVVVVGYGSVKKTDLTGAVGSISSDELLERGTTSVLEGMQGTVAGVDISSNSVKPGGTFDITIRGQSSFEDGGPLFVVDGIVTDDINFLNPADIQRIDILKDASSTAIYGSRGSRGVVLIETKNATNTDGSKINVSYDAFYGSKQIARMPDFMDAREFAEYRAMCYLTYNTGTQQWEQNESSPLANNAPVIIRRLYHEDYTDWFDLVTERGHQQNHYINLSGNSNNLSYNVGFGYQDEKANFKQQFMNRYNLKLSINHKASEQFQMGATANLSQTLFDNGNKDGYEEVNKMAPFWNAYWPDGSIVVRPGADPALESNSGITGTVSPLAELAAGKEETRRHDILANAFMEVKPIPSLTFRTSLSTRFGRERYGEFIDLLHDTYLDETYNVREASSTNEENYEVTWDNIVTFNKQFGDHNITATGVVSAFQTRREELEVSARNLPFASDWYNLFSGDFDPSNSSSGYQETSLLSYLGRVNYDFQGKYLVTASIRADGSSKLADRWASFPSFAVAWRISEESFLQSNSLLSNLKLRFSYGNSGNYNVAPYATKAGPDAGNTILYNFGGNTLSGFAPGVPVNPNLAWEKTRELNFAVDFGLFNDRVGGSVDIYDRLSDGVLMPRRLAAESGVESMVDNIGTISNKGVEIVLRTMNIKTPNLTWTTNFTFARNVNAIEELYGRKEDVVGEKRFIGQPINVEYDYLIDGVWTEAEYLSGATVYDNHTFLPGEAKTVDVDGDGSITTDDQVILGTNDPKWIGGLTSRLTFKNWDFSFNIITRQGVFGYDEFMEEYLNPRSRSIVKLASYDYYLPANAPVIDWNNFVLDEDGEPEAVGWTTSTGPENADARFPLYRNHGGPFQGSDPVYTDQSFVKVKNINLGYNLNNGIPALGINYLRVYTNIINPFVFADYDGYDPEYAPTSLEDGNGPAIITYQLGVNAKF